MSLIDSNEPWLGKVPSDWVKSRIRNVAKLSPAYSGAQPKSKELCTVVPMEMLFEDGSIDMSEQHPFEDIQGGLTSFEEGDVLFAKITPCMENGKGCYIEKLPTRYGFGSTEFHVLRPTPRVLGKFLYYVTHNPVFRAYAAENMTGAAGQKRVTSRFLKDTRLFLPTLSEQRLIVAYLDASCAAIDAVGSVPRQRENAIPLTGVLNRQLDILMAYRKSLIHECITGKRRVTEADVQRVTAHG